MAEGERTGEATAVSNSDDPSVRDEARLVEAIATRITGGLLPPLLDDEGRKAAEAARAAADELEVGRNRYRRFFGADPATDVVARAFARFDGKQSGPQVSEFYRYSDPSLANGGHI